jgi:hypothetical protein
MNRFVTQYSYNSADFGREETNDLPSETRQSDYEPLGNLVARVIRGEIMLDSNSDEYEFDENSTEADYDRENPFDAPDFDFSDAGSIYQDDIRQQLDLVDSIQQLEVKDNKNNNAQEREQSSADTEQSDANVPV